MFNILGAFKEDLGRYLDDCNARASHFEKALEKISNGEGYYGAQAKEYKDIAREALKTAPKGKQNDR